MRAMYGKWANDPSALCHCAESRLCLRGEDARGAAGKSLLKEIYLSTAMASTS